MSMDEEAFESDSFEASEDDFVPALFARDLEEAEQYCDLLSDHDIPARPGMDEDIPGPEDSEHRVAGQRGMTHGVPVLVPETLLDEASEVIADREEFADLDEEDEDLEEDDDETLGLRALDSEEEAFLPDHEEEDPLFDDVDETEDMDELGDEEDDEDKLY